MDHVRQPADARVEPLPAVLVEEEPGVGEPRAQHALVAGDDGRRVARREVADEQEAVGEPARVVRQREVALVELHREDQALLRHGEERGVERAGVDDRPLDQRRDLVEQRVGHDRRRVAGGALELHDDVRAAGGERRDHLAFRFQRRCVGIGRGELDRPVRQEAVAERFAPGGEAECCDRHDVRSVQRDQPVRGPDELLVVVIAARAGVAHHLRDGQPGDRVGQRLGEGARERRALGETAQPHVVGLAVGRRVPPVRAVHGFRRARRQVRAPERCELLAQRLRGFAIGPERDLGRHQLVDDLGVRRHRKHVRHRYGEAPRRRVRRRNRARRQHPARAQALDERAGERLAQPLQRLRRELLGEELDQQRRRAHATAFRCSAGSIG